MGLRNIGREGSYAEAACWPYLRMFKVILIASGFIQNWPNTPSSAWTGRLAFRLPGRGDSAEVGISAGRLRFPNLTALGQGEP